MIEALIAEPGIDWRRVVTAFHMDEYIGLPADAPQRFAVWLRERLFGPLTKASASAQAHGGGGQIAGVLSPRTGGSGACAKFSSFF
jgi:6-phosphogluconolactonase/glucosamine-6-phosphate isomerase/deaminase